MTFTKSVVATAALSLAAGSAFAGGHMSSEMTIVSWGGAYSKSQLKAYHEPYSAITGVTILNDESSSTAVAKLRAMNEANNITWDVVDVEAGPAMQLCDEGLAMVIDPDTMLARAPNDVSAADDFGDMLVSECFIPQIVYSTTFGYRTDLVGSTPPTNVCDVFDTAAYPGKRSLFSVPINTMEWALLCDGVAKTEIYDVLETPEGQDQAFAKLDTIKDDVIWVSSGADTPQLLADGEVVMGATYNGRLFALIEEQKQPVAMIWDGQVMDLDGWIIPAGLSPERQARALDYIMFATDTTRLADQAKWISYGPARKSSAPLVGNHAELGIDMAPHMPTNPENLSRAFLMNYSFWADYRDDLNDKFQAWLAK